MFSYNVYADPDPLSFPVLRAAMPGAPPIGTALDYIVLFPCLCLVALLLVGSGVHLLWRESALLRRTTLDHEEPADDPKSETAPESVTAGR